MRPLRKTGIRRLRDEAVAQRPAAELAFLLQSVADPVNVGALFRIADACGASELFLVGDTPRPPHPGIGLTSRGCDRRVPWQWFHRIEEGLGAAREAGYQLVAVELADGAVPHTAFAYGPRVCLVLGNEGAGVWPKTLSACDGAVYIPMYGKGPSLNVHVSAAVVAWEVLHVRALVGAPG